MEISLSSAELPQAQAPARSAALGVLASARLEGGGYVEYRSRGLALVVGPGEAALAAARGLSPELTCVVVDEDHSAGGADAERFVVARGRLHSLTGYLGAFLALVHRGDGPCALAPLLPGEPAAFDLVLDLSESPYIAAERPPVGYFRAGGDAAALGAALQAMPGLVGEFQKPTYFAYRESICAHGARGIVGCTRCLDACATEAIRPAGDGVEVDPNLCQGCGSCATTCPSGAMGYAFPSAPDLLGVLRRAITAYREIGGLPPALLFHDEDAGGEIVAALAPALPERVVPVSVEDVGAVGPEAWFALLAFGAADVLMLLPPGAEAGIRRTSGAAVELGAAILAGCGEDGGRIRLADGEAGLRAALADLHEHAPRSRDRGFSVSGTKREVWQRALAALADPPPSPFALPAGAPFGRIAVDPEACTLCMACAAVCPVEAITTPGDRPRLDFSEDRCVQCGICEQACPEDAIALEPRMAAGVQSSGGLSVLNEDRPFHCVRCGKAFASESVIARVTGALAEHWMFTDDRARRRLEMCEDCRVRDLLAEEGGMDRYT